MSPRQILLGATLVLCVAALTWSKLYQSPVSPQSSSAQSADETELFEFPTGEEDYYIPDKRAGHLHKPGGRREVEWVEHPKGQIQQFVNNAGFREDSPTMVEKAQDTYRILVAGDSHIDGVVYNSESFPNRLEELINVQG